MNIGKYIILWLSNVYCLWVLAHCWGRFDEGSHGVRVLSLHGVEKFNELFVTNIPQQQQNAA